MSGHSLQKPTVFCMVDAINMRWWKNRGIRVATLPGNFLAQWEIATSIALFGYREVGAFSTSVNMNLLPNTHKTTMYEIKIRKFCATL